MATLILKAYTNNINYIKQKKAIATNYSLVTKGNE